ncbi:MAG: hypothetical protein WA669_20025, partial [Pseudolabrys sp.]
RIKEMPIPQIERDLHQQLQQHHDDEEDGERRDPCPLGLPELRGGLPETRQKALLVENQRDLVKGVHAYIHELHEY